MSGLIRVFSKEEFKYVNSYGLLNAHPLGGVDENTILYSYQYYLLSNCSRMKENIANYISHCRVRPGIYNQYPELKGTKEDYMSHDQLTTIMNFSYKHNLNWHKEIWEEILKQKFRYDNINPEKPSLKRFLHPRDIIYYAYLNNHIIGYIGFFLFSLITAQSMLSTKKVRPTMWAWIKTRLKEGYWSERKEFFKTDGQLLIFTKVRSCRTPLMKKLKILVDKILIKKYTGWNKFFSIYFPEDHPNVNRSKGI